MCRERVGAGGRNPGVARAPRPCCKAGGGLATSDQGRGRAERDAPPPWVGGGARRCTVSVRHGDGLPFFAERQVKFAKGTAYM